MDERKVAFDEGDDNLIGSNARFLVASKGGEGGRWPFQQRVPCNANSALHRVLAYVTQKQCCQESSMPVYDHTCI